MTYRLVSAGTLILLLAMSGCVPSKDSAEADDKNPAQVTKQEETDTAQTKVQTNTEPKLVEEEVVPPKNVKSTSTWKSVKELEQQALYSTEITADGAEVRLFITPKKGGEQSIIPSGEASFAGQDGDELYTGTIEFYIADADGTEGYLQSVSSSEMKLNLTREPFVNRSFGQTPVVQVSEAVAATAKELHLFAFRDGMLARISVAGDDMMSTATDELKVVDGGYIQSYMQSNGKSNGWMFKTYAWNPNELALTFYDKGELYIEGPYYYEGQEEETREFYQSIIDNWHQIPHYVYQFPHLHYPEDLPERLAQGYILESEASVGASLSAYTNRNPEHLGEYDSEGGWFYAYPNGQSVHFDKLDDAITAVELSGANYTESVSELKALLGEPIYDSKDDSALEDEEHLKGTNYDVGDVLDYEFGDYRVSVTYEDERVLTIFVMKAV